MGKAIAWVTGSSSGIGRAVAERLAADGWVVAVSARKAADLQALADGTPDIHPFVLDVTDESAVRAVVTAIEATLGPIDLAVLAAGTHEPVEAAHFDVAIFRRLIETNLMGTVHAIAALLPSMLARRAGQIGVVSSVAGYRGLPTAAAYGATKAALINMTESLKFDLDHAGIRISLINPGFVRTPLTDKNPFPMPFLIEPEVAADRIVRGLARGAFEITFPRRFTWMLKVMRCLPYWLYFKLVARSTGK